MAGSLVMVVWYLLMIPLGKTPLFWGTLAGILQEVDDPLALWGGWLSVEFNGEFDPGSGRTLAACLTHASRAVRPFRGYTSGERVSNT